MRSFTGATCDTPWHVSSACTRPATVQTTRISSVRREEMMAYDLEFEKPLADLEKKIVALQRKGDRLKPDELRQLHDAERDLRRRTEDIYKNLTSWETVQVARHKDRPYSSDFLHLICDDFFELHGDRSFGDDHAIMAGAAEMDGQSHVPVRQKKRHA